MISLKTVDAELKNIGQSCNFWGRKELKELSQVMNQDEHIKQCVNGHYEGGWAMLIATDQRILLIDRKLMFLTIEALWYDKINQVDFSHRLLNATVRISSMSKDLHFTSWNHARLRNVLLYTQEKMIEAKQQASQPQPAENTSPAEQAPAPVQAPLTAAQPADVVSQQSQLGTPFGADFQPIKAFAAVPTVAATGQPQQHMNQAGELHFPAMPQPTMPRGQRPFQYAVTRLPFSRRRYYRAPLSVQP